jgi:hypothetical protein
MSRCSWLPGPAQGPSRNDGLALETTEFFAPVFMAGGRAGLRSRPPHPGPLPLKGGEGLLSEPYEDHSKADVRAVRAPVDTGPTIGQD